MKNVFEQDLAEKRQKVKLIKSGQFTRKEKDTDKGFVFLHPKAEFRQSYLSTRDCLLDQSNGGSHNDNNNNLPVPPLSRPKETTVIDAPIIRELHVYPATTISPITYHGSPMTYHATPPVTCASMTADLTYALSPRAFETDFFPPDQSQQQQQQQQSSSPGQQQQGDVPSAFAALGLGTALTNWFRRSHVNDEDPHQQGHGHAEQNHGTPERKQRSSSSGMGSKPHAIPRVSMTVSPTGYDHDDGMEQGELGVDEDKKEVDMDTDNEKLVNRFNPAIAKPFSAANNAATVSAATIGQGRRQSYAALLREQRAAAVRSTISTSTNKATQSTSR